MDTPTPGGLDRARGIVPALLTPYADDGSPALDVLAAVVQDLLAAGVDGFYVGGSTGDGVLQTPAERLDSVRVVVEACAGRVPVIAHVGTPATVSTLRLAEAAADAGAAAVSAISPSIPLERGELLAYFTELARAAPVPFIPYHFPQRSGHALDVGFFAELAQFPTVAGVKFTSLDLFTLARLARLGEGRLIVWNGHDEVLLGGLTAGAGGAIGSTFNVAPRLYLDLFAAVRDGDHATAVRLQQRVTDLVAALVDVGVMPALRELLRLSGHAMGSPRHPQRDLTGDQRRRVAELHHRLTAVPA